MKKEIKDGSMIIYLDGRIDSNNAAQVEGDIMEAIQDKTPDQVLSFDVNDLEYISSAGLRVLLKTKKKIKSDMVINNTSDDVYEIFHTTGFTDIFDVRRKFKEISVEGCSIIGQGGNGTIYRKDDELIVKVFNPGVTPEKIELEKKYARAAFTAGLPTMISFQPVRVGECYGITFEMLDTQTVGQAIIAEPERVDEYGKKMGELLKQMHQTEIEEGVLLKIKDKIAGWIDYLEEAYVSDDLFEPKDIEAMRKVLASIPDSMTVIHSDFHEGNVMVQDGELILIDIDDICTGHPIFDLVFNYMSHVIAVQTKSDAVEKSLGLTPELAIAVRKAMLKEYFGVEDEAGLEKIDQVIGAYTSFIMLLTPAKSRNSAYVTKEVAIAIIKMCLPNFRKVYDMLPSMLWF